MQNRGNIDAAGEFIAEEFLDHSAPSGLPPGLEGAKAIFAMIRAGFPDHDAVVHDMIAEGDKVGTRKSFTGTHQGDFFGVQPTGKRATMNVIDIVRVRDGKIVEHWNVIDLFGLMQQRGAISQSTQAESDTVFDGFQITGLGELLGAVAAGRFRVPVDATLPLSKAADAHRPLEDRANLGKVLLTMSEPAQEGR